MRATALTALAVAYYVAFVRGVDMAALSDVHVVAACVFALGLAEGFAGGDLFRVGDSGSMDRGLLVESMLATVAMLAATGALLTGSEVLLAMLVSDIVLLWAAGTVRHLALPRPAARAVRREDVMYRAPDGRRAAAARGRSTLRGR
ncbi:hypothetical protein AB0J82_23110 [Asanoa sp. NPDC049518]|uniref:hypothetical protein n=1 Tax=unclassified Asanoa TaxID=2685164 RepID=UPI00343AFC2C